MSNHLIQPIELIDINTEESLGLQCIKHGNTTPKWRTVSALLNEYEINGYATDYIWTILVNGEDGDKWAQISESGNSWYQTPLAGVKFATSCLKKVTLRFYVPEITYAEIDGNPVELYDYDYLMSLRINNVQIETRLVLAGNIQINDPAQTVDYIVDLVALGIECRPCGNIWTIVFGNDDTLIRTLVGDPTMEIVDVTF
jgi:hypothetical protein